MNLEELSEKVVQVIQQHSLSGILVAEIVEELGLSSPKRIYEVIQVLKV